MISLTSRDARRRRFLGVAGACVALVLLSATPAFAEAPWWRISSRSAPTYLRPGDKGDAIVVAASDLGDGAVQGSGAPITITDALPDGLTATSVSGRASFGGNVATLKMECSAPPTLSCRYAHDVPPYERLEVTITVDVGSGVSSGEENSVSVEGGEAPNASLTQPITVRNEPTPFGVEQGGFELAPETEGGSSDTQAGSHPFQLTTTLNLNQTIAPNTSSENGLEEPSAPALVKDLHFNLPPGLVGDPSAIAQCSDVGFSTILVGDTNLCPSSSAVGVAIVTLNVPTPLGFTTEAVPLFNLVPAPGEPARFGFEVDNVPVILDASVHSGSDYSVEVSVSNASQTAQILGSQVTLWGIPGDPRHDQSRGWACLEGGVHAHKDEGEICTAPDPRSMTPFLTLPTSCKESLQASVAIDSWFEPGALLPEGRIEPDDPRWKTATAESPALEGCDELPFEPSIGVETEAHTADTPTGLTVDVHLPQQSTMEAQGNAEAAVKDTTVVLPQGVQISPAAADGLEACPEALVGFTGFRELQPGVPTATFSAPLPEPVTPGVNFCPNASKVGTVHIKTPLLPHELEGGVYLAAQNANPFGSLIAMYIVAQDPVSHVLVKLAGEVTLDEQTLQVVSRFSNTPQVPFEDLRLELFGGPRASLTSPPLCGKYTTTASFRPWSGQQPATPSSPPVNITAGPDGAPCSNPQPFAPGFDAEAANVQAGAFTPFTLAITRPDADQAVQSLSMHLPPGLAGMLSSIRPCPEPQAGKGACSPESLIGHTSVSAGLGTNPFTTPQGQVFITGPYKGAPFGLSIVSPAVAGPFNLGNVVVRSAISIDRNSAALTIVSDPLPTQLKGIPLQLQRINVTVDRPGFEFNPTSCNPMAITGTLTGAAGGSEAVSSRFQVANCRNLPFKPRLTASTKGQASKANGANFDVKVESMGLGQANIAKVRLQLPRALPARLTTLQKACTEGAFNTNPASCPEGSVIGQATIHTPVLSSALSGPAYLVSHGGAAFPDVEFVLQGEGITLMLDGKTQIKKQITYSKFESAPDAPFTVFEAVLPAGPHSALTTNLPEKDNFNLCSTSLSMPTEIVAQNGAVLKQTTKIALQGCKKVKASRPLSRAQLLKRALAACRKQHKHSRSKRQACEKQARKRYTAKKAARGRHKGPAHR